MTESTELATTESTGIATTESGGIATTESGGIASNGIEEEIYVELRENEKVIAP